MPCREHLAQLRDRRDILDRFNAAVLAVTFEPEAQAREFARHEALPFPLLRDPTGHAYEAYRLRRGTGREVWSWSAFNVYVRAALRGRWPQLPRGDIHQLGGDFVLDRFGRIVFAHRGAGPADRPLIDDLMAAVRGAADDHSREVNRGT